MPDKNNVMPNHLDAEQALLGCMLIDNEILPDVLEKLTEDDFYQESHQFILSAMKMNYNSHRPVDLVTLIDRLETDGNLEKAGGVGYLTELTQITPSSANYNTYFDIVRRDSVNRRLIRASRDIIKYAQSSDDSMQSVQYAESLVYDISRTNDSSSVKDIRESDGIDQVINKFQLLAEDKDAYRGVMTGFTRLDKLTNGLQKTDLIVIAARPGMGKTSIAMNIIENAALNNDKVCAVFSLEMPETQIIQRLMCSYAGVSMSDALSGNLSPNDWKKIAKASEKMRRCRINIDDSSRVTPAEILSKCRRIKAKNNGQLDLVMIDYIQLMSSGKGRRYRHVYQPSRRHCNGRRDKKEQHRQGHGRPHHCQAQKRRFGQNKTALQGRTYKVCQPRTGRRHSAARLRRGRGLLRPAARRLFGRTAL